jgi:hypothetical protein
MSELTRLCSALAKRLSEQSDALERKAEDPNIGIEAKFEVMAQSVLLASFAVALEATAEDLRADAQARLKQTGAQSSDLMRDEGDQA